MSDLIKVGIEKNWDGFWITDDDFLSQARDGPGRWGRYSFSIGYTADCDYLIVLNRPRRAIKTNLERNRIWGVIQEPPNEIFAPMHKGQPGMGKVYNQLYEGATNGRIYHLCPPLIPWFVQKSWRYLADFPPPNKTGELCCVTSKNAFYMGHQKRLRFLSSLENDDRIDFYGRGYKSFKDKWDILIPYKFSLVIENHVADYYWTEKIIDCILTWTIPIYYGSKKVSEIFPSEAVIPLDIEKGDAEERLFRVANEIEWESRLEALDHARKMILNEYCFFAKMASELDRCGATKSEKKGNVRVLPVSASILSTWMRSYRRKAVLNLLGRA